MMIETFVLFGHLVVAGLIIALVLLQRGKGAEAGTGFGAGASGTVFGSRGSSNFFSRTTGVLAALFFATSLALAYFATRTSGADSLLEGSVFGTEDAAAPADTGPAFQAIPEDQPPVQLEDPDAPPEGPGDDTSPPEPSAN